MFSAEEVLAAPFQDGGHNTGHRSVKCSVTISYADLDRRPGGASYATAAIGRSAPESARAHSILLSVAVVRGGLVSWCQQTGPALVLMDPLRQGLRATGLLNDLVSLTAIRLSSPSAGPDATRIGVVFIGTDAVRTLAKRTGRDRPQDRVTKSTGIGRLPPASVGHRRESDENPASGWYGAMQQTMCDMVPIL
jgi:hypothetical protein